MSQCTETPEDYVLSTGKQYSVRQFCNETFKKLGMEIEWKGEGVNEVAFLKSDPSRILIRVDERYFRPTEVDTLLGDCSKAKKNLGWELKHDFNALVDDMIDAEKKALMTGDDNWA